MKLHNKLSACVAGGLVTTAVATSLLALRSKERDLKDNLRYMSEKLTVTMSDFCAEPLSNNDYPKLNAYLSKASTENPDICYLRVWQDVGHETAEVVARYSSPGPRPPPEMGYLVFRQPIFAKVGGEPRKRLGYFEVAISTAQLTRIIHISAWRLIPGYIISFSLLAIVINLVLKKSVLDPVRTLDKHAGFIGQGNLNDPIAVQSNDELGGLATTMESMRVNLKSAYESIERQMIEIGKSRQKFEGLLESAPDAMIIGGKSGHILFVNSEAERIFGYSRSEFFARQIDRLLVSTDDDLSARNDFASKASSVCVVDGCFDLVAVPKGGRSFPVTVRINTLDIGGDVFIVVAVRDNSERKKMEDELQQSKKVAESASLLKSRFLANMSHEIRTPLTVILSNAALVGERLARDEVGMSLLEGVERSGKHLLTLIDNILDLSKIESGQLEFESCRCSPVMIIADALLMMSVEAQEKGISLVDSYETDIPEFIESDPIRIRQLLINLVSNAIKFTQVGSVIVSVSLRESEDGANMLDFRVADTGIGIPEEKVNEMFKPFRQLDSSDTRRYGGSGLGLSICWHIAKHLGGEINVESELGVGSAFTFSMRCSIPKGARMIRCRAAEVKNSD